MTTVNHQVVKVATRHDLGTLSFFPRATPDQQIDPKLVQQSSSAGVQLGEEEKAEGLEDSEEIPEDVLKAMQEQSGDTAVQEQSGDTAVQERSGDTAVQEQTGDTAVQEQTGDTA